MTSVRRMLSPVPRPGSLRNEEACSVASPLSRSSPSNQSHLSSSDLSTSCGSLDHASYRTQGFVLGLFSQRSLRSLDRPKLRGQIWRRALSHFFFCFLIGVFVGLTPFVSMNFSMNLMSKHHSFLFEVNPTIDIVQLNDDAPRNMTPLVEKGDMDDNSTSELHVKNEEARDELSSSALYNQSFDQEPNMTFHKLLLVVTPTYARPFQAYYLNRLAHTLKVVSPPVLWIVVEMTSQSVETADVLRNTGVMYRHLVCSKNSSEIKDRAVQQRNAALSHIEMHRLDGIVYFADDDNIYSAELFNQMRQIRRFGTWKVAKLMQGKTETMVEGPICNGTRVVGWHSDDVTRRFRRFHAELSGFAFNSTVLWNPKGWHRPTLEPIMQLDTVKEGFRVSTFIEQIVEDESQMEGLPPDCPSIMVWNLNIESSFSYPPEWFIMNKLDAIIPLVS